jgi:nicotinamidase-related amidase
MARPSTHERHDPKRAGIALLITDMISTWNFPHGGRLLTGATAIAPRIARLKARCRAADAPVIYANDNRGRWRSDFRQLVAMAVEQGGAAAAIVQQLAPEPDDFFVLKPKHSAFFATPVELLLQYLRIERLIITGVAADQCVLLTATDARMRSRSVIPRDCIAAETAARTRAAIRYFDEVLAVPTTPAARLRFDAGGRG